VCVVWAEMVCFLCAVLVTIKSFFLPSIIIKKLEVIHDIFI
jgi:hypothetical protein